MSAFGEIGEVSVLIDYEEYMKRLGHKPSYIYPSMVALRCFVKEGYNWEKYEDYNRFLIKHTVNKRSTAYFDVLKKFVKWKFKEDRELKNIVLESIQMTGKKARDPKPRNSIITEAEQMRIIQNIKTPKHQLIAWLQKESGVRAGDVLRTLKDNFKMGMYTDDDGSVRKVMDIVFVKKGDRVAKIPIFNPHLIQYLKVHLENLDGDEDLAFINRDVVSKKNKDNEYALIRRNYNLYHADLKQACDDLGYDSGQFSTHDWRRNFANRIWVDVLKKNDIVALQRAMGHSQVETTAIYLRQSGLQSRDIYKQSYDLSK